VSNFLPTRFWPPVEDPTPTSASVDVVATGGGILVIGVLEQWMVGAVETVDNVELRAAVVVIGAGVAPGLTVAADVVGDAAVAAVDINSIADSVVAGLGGFVTNAAVVATVDVNIVRVVDSIIAGLALVVATIAVVNCIVAGLAFIVDAAVLAVDVNIVVDSVAAARLGLVIDACYNRL
jgi:hypothetical protein